MGGAAGRGMGGQSQGMLMSGSKESRLALVRCCGRARGVRRRILTNKRDYTFIYKELFQKQVPKCCRAAQIQEAPRSNDLMQNKQIARIETSGLK